MRYALTLTLNVDDPDAPLAVAITGEVGGPPIAIEGGAYQLQRGDIVDVKVLAGSTGASPRPVKISSLALAASPAGEKKNKFLSPFEKYDACAVIKHWGLAATTSVRGLEQISATPTLHPLTVVAKRGRWSIAGYLSLLIGSNKKEDGIKPCPRFYDFKLDLNIGD